MNMKKRSLVSLDTRPPTVAMAMASLITRPAALAAAALSASRVTRPSTLIPRPSTLAVAAMVLLASVCGAQVQEKEGVISLATPNYRLNIQKQGFCFGFTRADGSLIVPAHASSGLEFSGGAATATQLKSSTTDKAVLEVTNDQGEKATVELELGAHQVRFSVTPATPGQIIVRTGGLTAPAYGLSDHAAFARTTTDVTGYTDEKFRAQEPPGHKRMVSNFVICPQRRLAVVNMEQSPKIVRVTAAELAQGTVDAPRMPALYYFLGTPEEIYAAFLAARNRDGYPVYRPKYEFFGVGWEAFGALGWKTNEKTVTENVEKYLALGYPLSWMVVGSGFWPNEDPNLCATTSFGLWDKIRYPDPKRFIAHFKAEGLKVFLGLRISFIKDGPYSAEGVAKGYFLKENGVAKAYKIAFPKLPAYLLDGSNPEAVQWYLGLCQKWIDAGVDGFKEDLFGYGVVKMRDGNIDYVNRALMDKGVFIMGRNNYLGSACDTHRIEDFNFDQNQDRGPLNVLAFSYSGLPYAYPDIVGGTFGEGRKMLPLNAPRMQKYMMRVVQFDAVCPSMAVGMGPWNFSSAEVDRVMLAAAQLHGRLQPYIFSAAMDAFETGFPWTLAPLPLVCPDDPQVAGRENTTVRGYEWMFGPSLLACPLYGDDYWQTDTRDVYLPAGKWMEYDTGEIHEGPKLLKSFALPCGKQPLFVGGKGVLVLRDLKIDALTAKVYPLATGGSTYRFTHRDGTTRTLITNANTGWTSVTVTDTITGQLVPTEREAKTGALKFPLTPGHNYRLTDGK
jgi:alpha-glucosidase (family GH31 glycosyl hydrolase)